MENTKFKKYILFFCYCFIYLLFIINVLFNTKLLYLEGDEPFTFELIHHSFLNIMTLTAKDVHPFIYYFIAKIGISPFKTKASQIMALRIVSALPYLFLLIIGNTTIRRRFSNKTALTYMFFTITMPLLVQKLYQARMYGWAALFTTVVFILFMYVCKNILSNSLSSFIWISIFALLASLTHYYALIAVAIMYILFTIIFIIYNKKLRYLFISIVLDIIFYLPWLSVLLKQTRTVSHNFWIAPMNIKAFIEDILNVFNPTLNLFETLPNNNGLKLEIFSIFSLLVILTIIILFIKTKEPYVSSVAIGLALPFAVLVIGVILGILLGHTVIIIRYLTPTMSILWLSVAILLGKYLNNKNTNSIIKYIPLCLLLLLGILSYSDNLHQVKASINQFKPTYQIYNKIPNHSITLYNSFSSLNTSAPYTKHNVFLGHLPLEDIDVFHLHLKHTYRLPKHTNIYFMKTSYKANNISKFSKKFFNKYKSKMVKEGTLKGQFTLYKVKN